MVPEVFGISLGLILGQKRVNEKTNEITAIPELLDMLEIKGCIITIDAMGTRKAIGETIIGRMGSKLYGENLV